MHSKRDPFFSKRFTIFSDWSQKIHDKKFLLIGINFHNLIKKRSIRFFKKKKKIKVESTFFCLSLSSLHFKKNIAKDITIDMFSRFLYYLQDLSLSINFIVFFSFFVLHTSCFLESSDF